MAMKASGKLPIGLELKLGFGEEKNLCLLDAGARNGIARASRQGANIAVSWLFDLGHLWRWGPLPQCQGVVWVRVERIEEPTAPGTLQLEMACQGNPGKGPALLLLQHSNLNHPRWCGPQPQRQDDIRLRGRVERGKEPRAPGTLGLENRPKESWQSHSIAAPRPLRLSPCKRMGT